MWRLGRHRATCLIVPRNHMTASAIPVGVYYRCPACGNKITRYVDMLLLHALARAADFQLVQAALSGSCARV